MVTGSFRLIVADDPALACFPTVRHWLSDLIGGLVTFAGSVFGTRISTFVPLPLSRRSTLLTGTGLPRSTIRPTPRFRPPSFGLPRYFTVRQRVSGLPSTASLASPLFSSLGGSP